MTKSEAIAAVSREQTRLIQLSDAIWDHPQVKYQGDLRRWAAQRFSA